MTLAYRHFLVLPVRIELTTSPLPRGCSTTELRQQEGGERKLKRSRNAAILAIEGSPAQADGRRPCSWAGPMAIGTQAPRCRETGPCSDSRVRHLSHPACRS